jgi:four helix bundle protein
VASNIAEGKGRSSDKELLQFLSRARGSVYEVYEVQTQLEIAGTFGYLSGDEQCELSEEASDVGRMFNGMLSNFIATLQDSTA